MKTIQRRRRLCIIMALILFLMPMMGISAFASSSSPAPSGSAGGTINPDVAFNSVVKFFATWIGRIGLVVAFVGAVMFGLAIKNDDADGKTRGLMTMISGFVVVAITLALNMFGL